MQGMPTSVRDQLASSYHSLPSVADGTRRYAQRILGNRHNTLDTPKYRTQELLTRNDVAAVKKLKDLDVDGYDFALALDVNSALHIEKGHGISSTKCSKGEMPLVVGDYRILPQLLNEGGVWENAKDAKREGQPLIKHRVAVDGKKYEAVFVIRPGRKTLALKSFYKP